MINLKLVVDTQLILLVLQLLPSSIVVRPFEVYMLGDLYITVTFKYKDCHNSNIVQAYNEKVIKFIAAKTQKSNWV